MSNKYIMRDENGVVTGAIVAREVLWLVAALSWLFWAWLTGTLFHTEGVIVAWVFVGAVVLRLGYAIVNYGTQKKD